MGCQQTSNPAKLTIATNTKLQISCIAHAAYYQQVTLSFSANLTNPIGLFSGAGEGVPMTLPGGSNILTLPSGSNSVLYAGFQFSTVGPKGPFKAAFVCQPIILGSGPTITLVTSEDSTDSDDNDSYLTVIDYTPV